MRRPELALTLLLASAAGCPSSSNDATPPRTGKDVGEACASEGECQAGLFCVASKCAAYYAPATTCTPSVAAPAPIADPQPIAVPQRLPNQCATAPATPTPATLPTTPGGPVFTVGQRVTFDVPPGITGLSIVSQAVSAPVAFGFLGHAVPNAPVPTDVRGPDGALFFSDTVTPQLDAHGYYDPTGVLAWYLGYGPTAGAFTIPNTSAALDVVRSAGQVAPGKWSFVVNDWAYECATFPDYQSTCSGGAADSSYRVDVLPRTGASAEPTLRSTGTLDLEIYLATTDATLASAAAAVADEHVLRFLETMRTYYARAGICIGNVTFHDLPDWAKKLYAPGGEVDIGQSPPCDPLSQLFTLAVGGTGPAVHLFLADGLVDRSSGPAGFVTLGVDGAIPGPSGVPGTIVGGAIVGLFDELSYEAVQGACSGAPDLARCGPDLVAYVAAHEAGHWLGLYHTTEMTGDLFDPLADTARCPCLSCAPVYQRGACSELGTPSSPTVMEGSFCASATGTCGGGANLMFWLVDDRLSTGELTPEQGEVMRQNPAVH